MVLHLKNCSTLKTVLLGRGKFVHLVEICIYLCTWFWMFPFACLAAIQNQRFGASSSNRVRVQPDTLLLCISKYRLTDRNASTPHIMQSYTWWTNVFHILCYFNHPKQPPFRLSLHGMAVPNEMLRSQILTTARTCFLFLVVDQNVISCCLRTKIATQRWRSSIPRNYVTACSTKTKYLYLNQQRIVAISTITQLRLCTFIYKKRS